MTSTAQTVHIDIRHALLAIARALDFVGIDDLHHGQRVAYMAYECAGRLGWPEDKKQFAYFAGLIHDCGVSSTDEHQILLQRLHPHAAELHCLRGYQALLNCPAIDQFATIVRYHHTSWQNLKHIDISPQDKDVAALVLLTDRVDYLRARYVNGSPEEQITLYEHNIAQTLESNAGVYFNPEMVIAMCDLVTTDGFWYNMDVAHIENMALDFPKNGLFDKELTLADVTHLARFLSSIVDAKSPFTCQHSDKVAELSRELSIACGLDPLQADMVYVAGLLHDVGKLKTPDGLLHKPAKLTREEYAMIKRHTVDTGQILQSFFPNSPIGQWAANHHERLDGSGYPFKKTAEQLDLPSRVIAIVDIFQSLTQERPYRGILSLPQVFEIMTPMVENGQLDAEVFNTLQRSGEHYYQLSQSPDHP